MRIGIAGATGAVGRQMLECLQERNIQADEIRLFASPRSAGTVMEYGGEKLTVTAVGENSFAGLDYVLGAVSADLAVQYAPLIRDAGAVFIDNSSAFRLQNDVPLVVPEINGEDAFEHHGIISNPNCSTIITMMAVAPIHRISPLKKLIASTYQAVSGAGNGGIEELKKETEALAAGEPLEQHVFPKQIAYNCIPLIGSMKDSLYTSEEAKMGNEGRKILHAPDIRVTCTCVRVPVFRSHSISVSLQCADPLTVDRVKQAVGSFPGTVLAEDGYPTPLETSGQDAVYVGRIREDEVFDGGIALWCCGDQIRKGAAANAVGILEYLIR